MRRRRRRSMDGNSSGHLLLAFLELTEWLWVVLRFAVRIPALVLRLLI